ncbi:hypothetical protein EX30DRAFT_318508 [Ascodesmis nigricans]|uniref:DNA helicase n=1 Tax=Ascodesmis nigricans TaxID=341454 RepID=A0A4S2MYN6_9PEZI|nr:hypothetical protein EX30DRAFT_318508 [Ascodesmis nigricans]
MATTGLARPSPFDSPDHTVSKRRKLSSSGTYNSNDDSSEELVSTLNLDTTQPTIPLGTTQPTQPLNDTQPTLPLGAHAAHPPRPVWNSSLLPASSPPASYETTQLTQPLNALTTSPTRSAPPVIQVPASSPFRQTSPLRPAPRPALSNAATVKPFDFYPSKERLDSEGAQYIGSSSSDEGSDHELKPMFGSASLNKPVPSMAAFRDRQASMTSPQSTKVDRIAESPVTGTKGMFSQFQYTPTAGRLDSLNSPNTAMMQRRPDPAKLQNLDLEKLPPNYRVMVERLKTVAPNKTLFEIVQALVATKCNFDEAAEKLTSDEVDLTAASLAAAEEHRAQAVHAASAKKQRTLNRGTGAGRVSIKDKYGTVQAKLSTESPSPPPQAPRRKLVRGGDRSSASVTPVPTPPPVKKQAPITLYDSDSDASMEEEDSEDERELERKVLNYINTRSLKEIMDISCTTEENAQIILDNRPYRNLDAVRDVRAPAATTTKTGKKTKGAKPRAIGEKIVDICLDTWRGYEAVDSLIRKVEQLGKPIAEDIKKWGVDIVSGSNAGELEMTDIKIDSDAGSLKDSGIGTPTDAGDGEDVEGEIHATKRSKQVSFFKDQPKEIAEGITLKDYQIAGINWLNLLYEKNLSCILADEMGLGKTCQVISFMAYLYSKGVTGPHLVVVPSSTLENWLREFNTFCPTLKVEPYYGTQKDRQIIRQTLQKSKDWNVLVTTYQIACGDKFDRSFLKNMRFNVCVYDEGHMLKNSNSARYDSLIKLPASFRLLLTGTPLQNNLQELASLLAFILPSVFQEKKEALQSIFKYKAKTTDDEESNSALLSQQRIRRARAMMTPFVLRRKKTQVLQHLPEKTTRVEYCEMNEQQRKIYNDNVASAQESIRLRAEGKKPPRNTANVMMQLRQASIHPLLFRTLYNGDKLRKMARDLMKEEVNKDSKFEYIVEDMEPMSDFALHQLCVRDYPNSMTKYALKKKEWMNSGKIDVLKRLLKKMQNNGDRCLIFSQFTMVLDILEMVLTTLGIHFLRIDGATPVEARQDLIDKYHEETDIMVFLLSTKAGGFGINLACANKVIIFDSSFNPHDDAQASDRAHRVGQTREVEVIRLITRGTIEEAILQLANTKLALDQSVSESDEKAIENKGEELVAKMLLEKQNGEPKQDKEEETA